MTENATKCERCGRLNPAGMRFCGMCGAPLDTAGHLAILPADDVHEPVERGSEAGAADSRTGDARAADTRADAGAAVPASQTPATPAPAYTGGTFRLMGQEVMSRETDSGRRNLDYLLEDDEESGSGGGGWIVMFLLALALAGGLGYWRYRTGGWPWAKFSSGTSHAQDASAADQTGNQSGNPAGGEAAPAENTVRAPAANAGGNAPPPVAGALTDVRPQSPAGSITANPQAPAAEAPAPAKPSAVPKHDADTSAAKRAAPAAADAPVKAEDAVTLGEKYIYGRGLPQNCERGLKLVRPAADAANGKAMITMGALYATGHCVARDLPTAYRYFALALRKDPENGALKQNAEMVWGQMTQSERQQAIRLTQ